MTKRLLIVVIALVFVASLSVTAGQGKDASWTGWVTDSHCGAKGENPKHASCATKCVKEMGAKWALYTPSDKKVYTLDGAADKVAEHAGHHVKVSGTVAGDIITVKSIEMTGEQKGQEKKN